MVAKILLPMNLSEIHNHKKQFATRMVGDELILVPLSENVADMSELFTLNEVGSFIWNCIDGRNTPEDILNAIETEFSVDKHTARKDLEEFLAGLETLMHER